jgi:hypothetical protein
MKRFIIALVVGGAVFGVVFAAAAALNVSGSTLQSGSQTDLTCTDEPVVVKWKTMVSGPDFKVAGAEIQFADTSCDGQKVLLSLQSAPGAQIGFLRGAVNGSLATANEFYSGGSWKSGETGVGPKAQDVNLVSVLVKNAWVAYDAPGENPP